MTESLTEYCRYCYTEHPVGKHISLEDVDRSYIIKVYEATGRNITHTADVLGIARSTLHNKLDQYGLRG